MKFSGINVRDWVGELRSLEEPAQMKDVREQRILWGQGRLYPQSRKHCYICTLFPNSALQTFVF